MSERQRPIRLAGFLSGGGRTLMNIADCIDRGELDASIELVVSSRAGAPGVELARSRGFDVRVAALRDFPSLDDMHDAITSWLMEKAIDLVCLCGYLRWLRVDEPFRNRVINIHPALLPKFGGKGMHGLNVHQAVLDAGETVSGCTVHYVDDRYDEGPIILQRTCPVQPDDDAASLAARVFAEECRAYPQAIRMLSSALIA